MPMTPERYLASEIIPALTWLTARRGRDMGPPEVLVQLLTTALHEGDGLKARVQYGPDKAPTPITKRPGHSMWMFEGGSKAALAGLMANPGTAPLLEAACEWLGVEYQHDHVWWCMVGSDKLAAVCARLLLLTDPHPVPMIDDVAESYACYLRLWRPGKEPGLKKWTLIHQRAVDAVARVSATPERYEDKPVMTTNSNPADVAALRAELAAIRSMIQPAALNATAGVAMTDKQLAAFRDQALIISPPSVGNQVIVSPPQSRNRIVQQALAVAGLLPYISQTILQFADPIAAAAHNNDWASVAGLALTGIAGASLAFTDGRAIKVAGQVATAAADPVGQTPLPTPIALPAPAAPLPDLSQLPDDVLDQIAARIRATQPPANAA